MTEGTTGSNYSMFPFDQWLTSIDDRLTFTRVLVVGTLLAATLDVLVFGYPGTAIPYNYPFFGDIVLVITSAVILPRTYRGLQDIKINFIELADDQLEDVSVALDNTLEPERIRRETDRILDLAYHPAFIGAGAVLGGTLVFSIMAVLGVLDNYPFWLMNFAFGAVHGLFIAPVVGAFVFVLVASRRFIVDINILDPDGVGGYRHIGNTLIRLVSYGIFLVTLDFVILSSVAFTSAERFQQVVAALYLVLLGGLIFGTVLVTLIIRSKLLEVREKKVARMEKEFSKIEYEYWKKHDSGSENQSEALQLMTMTTMFNEISRMNMWPINLYSLLRLSGTIGFSVTVFLIEISGLLSDGLPIPFTF